MIRCVAGGPGGAVDLPRWVVAVLVTGGAGFIGSAVTHALADAGLDPVVLDDLSAGSPDAVAGFPLYVGDFADAQVLDEVFAADPVVATIHCAARKSVPESVAQPLVYYRENVAKTLALVEHLLRHRCHRLVFSSSASVYADRAGGGVREEDPTRGSSPYARTKLMVEQILSDIATATDLRVVALRYFNPIGADPRRRTGPSDLGPTALGALIRAVRDGVPFELMGTDWPTPDGTAVRDYVHVWDVARAHVAAVVGWDAVFARAGQPDLQVLNVGSGRGTSLRELVAAFGACVPTRIGVVETGRRPGDVAGGYAVIDRAVEVLRWRPERTIEDGIRDALAWEWGAQAAVPASSPRHVGYSS